jgi:glycine/D-amino acid oxidase-like deaminating enzyme
MRSPDNKQDAVIIGGGFYGTAIAIYLARQRGLKKIQLVERESNLLARASYNNQARIHNGYHYPRNFATAYRSRVNLPKFIVDWPDAVGKDFTNIYAIARRNSKTSARQFERFCKNIDAKCQRVTSEWASLFDRHFIEDVFAIEEYTFDSIKLAQWAELVLKKEGINVRLGTQATEINQGPDNMLQVLLEPKGRDNELVCCRYVFNCAYSGLNHLKGDLVRTQTSLKHEIAELALMKMPSELKDLGITVMDGPFFSMLPFPARAGLHTLSHVRFTPHLYWNDEVGIAPYERLCNYDRVSRVDRMVRDAGRYLPAIRKATYITSLFETKTILRKNEGDDGRPILFEKSVRLPGYFAILGGKIDNVYDILEKLDNEQLSF